jgi:hypothetical protein
LVVLPSLAMFGAGAADLGGIVDPSWREAVVALWARRRSLIRFSSARCR